VRETFCENDDDGISPQYSYRADHPEIQKGWKPSIHMPYAASRIDLEITRVSVQRLQEIVRFDVIAEGISAVAWDEAFSHGRRTPYADLWEAINGKGSWETNPFVWVICFKLVKP
jgi:hypothetical protein